MSGTWFSGYADELARFVGDARDCAETCEAFLEEVRARGDPDALARAVGNLAPPAAVSRVLIDLIDEPPQLVLAAAKLCRDSAAEAADGFDAPEVAEALRRVAASAEALLEAAG